MYVAQRQCPFGSTINLFSLAFFSYSNFEEILLTERHFRQFVFLTYFLLNYILPLSCGVAEKTNGDSTIPIFETSPHANKLFFMLPNQKAYLTVQSQEQRVADRSDKILLHLYIVTLEHYKILSLIINVEIHSLLFG